MASPLRIVLSASLAILSGAAVAAGSSAPFGYVPDPALRTESPAQLQTRIRRACDVTQARLQSTTENQVARGCVCYAGRLIKALDATEIDAYRTTGVFNETARAKGYAAIDGCRLRRPA